MLITFLDGEEAFTRGTEPLDADTDGDTMTDDDEVLVLGSDPLDRDTDGDLFGDATEVAGGSDPSNPTSVPTPVGPVPGLDAADGEELGPTDDMEPLP